MRKVLTISIVLLQIMSGVYAQTEITTAEQFRQMKTDGNYILMSDIDLSTKPFVPIGGYNGYFSGTFDGNGHTITIGAISSSLDFYYRGLFAKIASEGVVKNLIVKGSVDNSEESASRVGAIAGANYGTIINCVSYAYVNSGGILNNNPKSHTTGGIAGVNGGTISYCLVSEKIMGSVWSSGTGGIVGSDSYENTGKIENCIYAADGISVPTNYSSSAMIDAYGMICGDTDGGRGANRTKNCYYIENGTFSGFGDPWGKDVPDDSRCYGLNVDGIRSLVGEGGIYASTEYVIFRNSILKAIAPEWYQNIDTYLTDGYFTFYNGDCNYVSDNSVTIYTGIVKGSNVYLFEMDGHIIPKGVPVILKSEYRYFGLYKSYTECTFNGKNDLKGTDNDLSCSASSNFILGINSGSSAFILNNNTKVSANTAYLLNQEEIEDYDFLSIKIIEPSPAISFVDDNVKAICVANWDFNGDGELNEGEAAIVTDLGQVFKGNTNITSFDELRYFTGLTSIGYQAFHGCSGLTSVTIGNGVTSIGYQAFYNCNGLTSIHVEEGNPKYDSRDNCNAIIETATNKLIKGCKNSTIPNTVTEIGDGAFQNCNNLTSINIPNSVTRIGCESFSGCNDLMSIIIGTGVTSIADKTFTGCNSLTSVTINSDYIMSRTTFGSSDNMKTIFGDQVTTYIIGDDVTSIGRVAFCGCTNLTSVTIGNSVISIGGSAFYDCSNLTSVIISNSVESIGSDAFHGCINLNSVTIPGSVKTIEEFAFYGCLSLTSLSIEDGVSSIGIAAFKRCGYSSLTIPNSVTSIGQSAFRETPWYDNQPDGLIYTGRVAYEYKGTMPDNTSVTIKEGTKHISTLAFNDCGGLVSITIPNSVTSIDQFAFSGCRGLTSVVSMIEEPFINEDEDIFNRYNVNSTCTLTVPVGTRDAYIAAGWTEDVFKGGIVEFDNRQEQTMELISLPTMTYGDESNTLPVNTQEGLALTWTSDAANVATISGNILTVKGVGTATITATQEGDNGYKPFSKEFTLTVDKAPLTITAKSYTIKQGETLPTFAVEYSGFKNNETEEALTKKPVITCSATSANELGTYDITVSDAEAENYDISYVTGTLTVVKPDNYIDGIYYDLNAETQTATVINGENEYTGEVSIPESVEYGNDTYHVTSIGSSAFADCSGLTSVTLPDNIVSIGTDAFAPETRLYVNKGSKTLLTFWNQKDDDGKLTYAPYDKDSDKEIPAPSLSIAPTTQTTASVKIENWCDGYTYLYNDEGTTEQEFNHTGLQPESTQNLTLVVSVDGVQYETGGSFTTQSLSPRIEEWTTTASSISATGAYTEDDAKVVASSIQIEGFEAVEGNTGSVSGMNPNTEYAVTYTIEVDYGGEETATYTNVATISTDNLEAVMAQPKVVSEGNVVVSATTNLDDEETNVGFEWRSTDWTDEFPSNKGVAYLYEGTMEGCIKNLNTGKLWKCRPYYLSNSGVYHYGEWTGIDPTNTSYFEPTVHTYSKVTIEGNTAQVSGYALSGTDEVEVQGFKYWRTGNGGGRLNKAVAIPADAMTVEVNGPQMMTASLEGLDYDSEYCCVAFVTTTDGNTFYGEEQKFITGTDPTGIESIEAEDTEDAVIEIARYNMNGQLIDAPQDGVNIIRYSDGTTKKIFVK